MKTQHFNFISFDGMKLPALLWIPDTSEKNIHAIVQITHGMTEHIGRYERLAEFLTLHGIAVAGFDLRGHGKNASSSDCASFGEGGWEASLEDMHLFYMDLQRRFSSISHVMLGFSLGSFLVREYLNRYDDKIDGAIILGTGYQPSAVLSAMMAVVKTQIRSAGFDATTPLVEKLSFGAYNQKFAPNRTSADWLCADEGELDKYRQDVLCRENISSGLFYQLLDAMRRTGKRHAYDNWNREMPVLLMSGEKDSVGDFGRGIRHVQMDMEKAGVKNVSVRLFSEARHDLLHEETSGTAGRARELLKNWILNVVKESYILKRGE